MIYNNTNEVANMEGRYRTGVLEYDEPLLSRKQSRSLDTILDKRRVHLYISILEYPSGTKSKRNESFIEDDTNKGHTRSTSAPTRVGN